MDYRRMGTSGLKVSEIGLGCNNFGMRIDQAATTAVVNAAIEAGITLFDTADIYGGTQSEVMLGVALGERRKDIVLATKFAGPLGAGANDLGGTLMNESISRAAGSGHGEEFAPEAIEALVTALGRTARPRMTSYADADPEKIITAKAASSLTPVIQTKPKKNRQLELQA